MDILNVAEIVAYSYPIIDTINIAGTPVKQLMNFDDVYEYISDLGNGSFGNVRSYREKSSRNIYAFKEIEITNKENIRSLNHEVDIMKNLSSKNTSIVQYHDSFIYSRGDTPIYVIVTEYIDGFTLKQYVARLIESNSLASPKMIFNLALWLFSTIAFIHDTGYVHRDIKPDNIMIDARGKRFVLLDFGLTCSLKGKAFESCDIKKLAGTPSYLSPERWIQANKSASNINSRSFFATITNDLSMLKKADVWAAGVTIFYIAERRIPWTSRNDIHTIQREVIGPYTITCTYQSPTIMNILSMALVRDDNQRSSASQIVTRMKNMLYKPMVPKQTPGLETHYEESIVDIYEAHEIPLETVNRI